MLMPDQPAAMTLRLPTLSLIFFLATAAHAEGPLAQFDPALSESMATAIRNADLDAGARYFDRKCSQCHDGDRNGENFTGAKPRVSG